MSLDVERARTYTNDLLACLGPFIVTKHYIHVQKVALGILDQRRHVRARFYSANLF